VFTKLGVSARAAMVARLLEETQPGPDLEPALTRRGHGAGR
jgi:hypothetical protein